jgi:Tol biopolymer transport system component
MKFLKRCPQFILNLILIFICGCSHFNKELSDKALEAGLNNQSRGDSSHPRFSPDGTKLIYASKMRSRHAKSQIYELDLIHNKERRVTFSDGDAFDPSYINDSEIIYSSTTDDIKENYFSKALAGEAKAIEFPGSDIYRSDRYGSEIIRLTEQPGFNGEATLVTNGSKTFVVYTSFFDNSMSVRKIDIEQESSLSIGSASEKYRRFPTLNKDRSKIAFLEKDKSTQEQSLVIYSLKSKKIEATVKLEGQYRDLFFAPRPPERIFYSVLRKGDLNYHIEMYDVEDKCTQIVLKDSISLLSPAVSDDSFEKIAFVRYKPLENEIKVLNLPKLKDSCRAPEPVSMNSR